MTHRARWRQLATGVFRVGSLKRPSTPLSTAWWILSIKFQFHSQPLRQMVIMASRYLNCRWVIDYRAHTSTAALCSRAEADPAIGGRGGAATDRPYLQLSVLVLTFYCIFGAFSTLLQLQIVIWDKSLGHWDYSDLNLKKTLLQHVYIVFVWLLV